MTSETPYPIPSEAWRNVIQMQRLLNAILNAHLDIYTLEERILRRRVLKAADDFSGQCGGILEAR